MIPLEVMKTLFLKEVRVVSTVSPVLIVYTHSLLTG